MRNVRNERLGLLERTIIEFKDSGNTSIEEIKEYLISNYKITVCKSILQKRLDGLGF